MPWIPQKKLATEKNAKNSRPILLRKVSKSHLETSLKRIWHEVFLGRQIIFYYMDGTETSSCLLRFNPFCNPGLGNSPSSQINSTLPTNDDVCMGYISEVYNHCRTYLCRCRRGCWGQTSEAQRGGGGVPQGTSETVQTGCWGTSNIPPWHSFFFLIRWIHLYHELDRYTYVIE